MSVPAWRTHYTPVALVYVSELEDARLQTPQSQGNMLKSQCWTSGLEWTQRRSTNIRAVLYI